MSKNVVIFSDGTGQAGGLHPDQRLSNVYKLYRAARSGPDSEVSPSDQVCYYDAGLGSAEIGGPFWKQPLEYIRKLLSSATGTGFSRNVIDCYEAILRHYQTGDHIYIFGFSRGAYTARTVGGVMNLCGVPTQDFDGTPLPNHGPRLREIAEEAVREVYEHGVGHPREKFEDEREEKARRFREKYACQDSPEKNLRGNVVPYFIGVFDTVAALGTSGIKKIGILIITAAAGVGATWVIANLLSWALPFSFFTIVLAVGLLIAIYAMRSYWKSHRRTITNWPKKGKTSAHFAGWNFSHYDRYLAPRIRYGRHAQAIDETRASFARVGWGSSSDAKNAPSNWLVQKWFPGNHSDIGGSYPEIESRLSDIALEWMVNEATSVDNGLLVDRKKLNIYPDAGGIQHCEVVALRQSLPRWIPKFLRFSWKEKVRSRANFDSCHESVMDRAKLTNISKLGVAQPYRPEALKSDDKFQKFVSKLPK